MNATLTERRYKSSGSAGTRTRNQRLKRALLYRLSYRPDERKFVLHRKRCCKDWRMKISEAIFDFKARRAYVNQIV
jgi:hypothetical protein